jgi:hypothetical protein
MSVLIEVRDAADEVACWIATCCAALVALRVSVVLEAFRFIMMSLLAIQNISRRWSRKS